MARKSRSLFDETENPIQPDPGRTEPAVWIRRLVVLDGVTSDSKLIRDVPFRLGLNVIATEERPETETRIVSHSVGKTLLMRLIRYCLGESHFAKADIVGDVEREFPGAHVVAEITVGGIGWVVVRPLKDGKAAESFAFQSPDWKTALATAERHRYSEFVEAIEGQVLGGLPEFRLPRANRRPHWVDVLGWLARDNECKYLHPNLWRHEDANPGTFPLDRGDAGLLMSWVMGLLDTAEIAEIAHREELLRDLRDAKKREATLVRRIAELEPILTEMLEMEPDELVAGGLYADTARKRIADRKEHYKKAHDAVDSDAAGSLQDRLSDADAAVKTAEAQIKHARDTLELGAKEVATKTPVAEDPDIELDPTICPLWRSHPECRDNRTQPGPLNNPNWAAEIARIRERDAHEQRRIAALELSLPNLRREAAEIRTASRKARKARDNELEAIQTAIGRWKLIGEQFEKYLKAIAERDASVKLLEKLNADVAESREKQMAAKGRRRSALRTLSAIYNFTLRYFLGAEAEGRIRTVARGLLPVPGRTVAANGDAMGFMGRVIAFDLACLAATVTGIGRLPGFWIHDSPNTVELEPALYQRLFRFSLDLMQHFGTDAPAFQYFVTTAGRVPQEVVDAEGVALRLDKRDPAKVLLGREF